MPMSRQQHGHVTLGYHMPRAPAMLPVTQGGPAKGRVAKQQEAAPSVSEPNKALILIND
ncbi:MAG: hypothetical protein KDA68_20700 [Planctomycetaceae bacterium]|nr:hypothetical protein [Planctomycetaceae bacterium]